MTWWRVGVPMPDNTPHESELAELSGQLKENKLLRQKLDALARRRFGKSSEKRDPGQLLLLLQGFDEGPKHRRPWLRRCHGARWKHRLRVRNASRACPRTFRWSRR